MFRKGLMATATLVALLALPIGAQPGTKFAYANGLPVGGRNARAGERQDLGRADR